MDYTKFLAKKEILVLPYFGGARVEARDRRLRLKGEAEPGWWEFEVEGRNATPLRKTDAADISDLPATRGHYACGWLFSNGRDMGRFALPLDDEPEPLAPCTGRRWYSGHLLFDCVDFEDEAEDGARRALEEGAPIRDIKGVGPGLRAAFGFALVAAAARSEDIPVSPREAGPHVHDVADRGMAAAEDVVTEIARQRAEWEALLAEERHERELIEVAHAARVRGARRARDIGDICDRVLMAAGARMLRWRRTGQDMVEVTFEFMDERFISLVDARTLNVYDSGICLSGADQQLTLESLPSAIREAIDTGQLHITRH